MRRILFLLLPAFLLAAFCAVLFAQSSPGSFLLPVWTGTRYTYPALGPSFVLADGRLDVSLPRVLSRKYDVLLEYDATAKAWKLPPGAENLVLYVNGLRYRRGVDYQVSSGCVLPIADNMQPDFAVTADYDLP